MTDLAPTELGQILEIARKRVDGSGISGREAARRAGISGTRWRQLIQDGRAPALTVVAAALAVQADPAEALTAAGLSANPDDVARLVETTQRPATRLRPAEAPDLAREIERIRSLPLPAAERLRVAQGVIDLFEEMTREQDADQAENGAP